MRIEPEKRVIKYDKEPDVLKISKAVTVESGNVTLTTGDLVLTAGDITQTGDQAITGDLVVTGDISGTGDLTRTGNSAITGNITGTGDITRTGDSAITGDITGTGAITRTGDITLTGDVLGTGDVTRTGDVNLTGGAVKLVATSADTGAESVFKVKQILHTNAGGGITETITGGIPANSWVVGLQAKIKVLVTGTTIANYDIGVGGDTDRFGNLAALTKNTALTPAAHEVEAIGVNRYYDSATDLLLTGNAGTFDAVGVTHITLTYIDLSPPDNYA